MNGVAGAGLALLVVAAVGAAPLAVALDAPSAVGTEAAAPAATNASAGNASVPPGARLAGVVGTHGAELRGEVETRAFNRSLDAAGADGVRAAVVARQYENATERLDALDARMAALRRAHRNGTVSDAAFRARLATLAARTRAVRRLVAAGERRARELPDGTLREHGVSVSDIGRLRERADDLTGPRVAAIARSVTGDPERGPPANRTRESSGRGAATTGRPTDAGDRGANGRRANATADSGGSGDAGATGRNASADRHDRTTRRTAVGDAGSGNANGGGNANESGAGGAGSGSTGSDGSQGTGSSANGGRSAATRG